MDPTKITWIFFFFGFGCTYVIQRKYLYVGINKYFDQAQSLCRATLTDLATIRSQEDVSMLIRPTSNIGLIWIGLHDDPKSWKKVMGSDSNSWRWSVTGQTSKTSYCNWYIGDPDFKNAAEACVAMIFDGTWVDRICNKLSLAICFDENANGKSYVVTTTMLTWKDSQAYCRQYHKDLALIENAADNSAALSVNTAGTVWIGLYRVPWIWSDKSNSTFRNWQVGKPDNSLGINHCVSELPDHTWTDVPCVTNCALFCYGDPQLKIKLEIKIQTDADMTDPACDVQIIQQIGAALMNQGLNNFKLKWRTLNVEEL